MSEPVTAGDGHKVWEGTSVIVEVSGDWGMAEALTPAPREMVLVRFPEGEAAWYYPREMSVAADQEWRPDGWAAGYV